MLLASISCWNNSQVTEYLRQIRLKWRHCNVIYSCHVHCSYVCIVEINCKTSPSLTHWGRVTHICVSKQIIIGSDNGLSPARRQVIIWTDAGKLLFGPQGTNFRGISIEIYTSSFNKVPSKMSSGKCRSFWLGLNVFIVGTLGCVFIDNETHESGVTKCTTGEAWSAFSWHHSSVFHYQWTHNQVFLLLSHMLI